MLRKISATQCEDGELHLACTRRDALRGILASVGFPST